VTLSCELVALYALGSGAGKARAMRDEGVCVAGSHDIERGSPDDGGSQVLDFGGAPTHPEAGEFRTQPIASRGRYG